MTVSAPPSTCEQLGWVVRQAQDGAGWHDAGSAMQAAELLSDAVVIRQYSAWIWHRTPPVPQSKQGAGTISCVSQ